MALYAIFVMGILLCGGVFLLYYRKKLKWLLFKKVGETLSLRVTGRGIWAMPLKATGRGIWDTPGLTGEVEGIPVGVRQYQRAQRTDLVEFRAYIRPVIQGDIRITLESLATRVDDLVGKKDIQSGDPEFDHALRLWATYPAEMICLLNGELRRLLLELYDSTVQMEIESGHVTAYIKRRISLSADTLVRLIRLCVSIAQNLEDPRSLEERCAHNIQNDPKMDVRLNNINALAARFPLKGKNIGSLKKALRDPEVEVQVAAARHLGKPGMEHLVKILKTGSPSRELTVTIVDVLGEQDYRAGIPALKKLYASREGADIKKAVLQAFTGFGSSDLASFLLEELEKKNPDLEIHIVRALGTCGGVEVVETLFRLGKASYNISFRRAVKDAINQIQSRLGDVEKGWLSLPDLQELDGALSDSGSDNDIKQ